MAKQSRHEIALRERRAVLTKDLTLEESKLMAVRSRVDRIRAQIDLIDDVLGVPDEDGAEE